MSSSNAAGGVFYGWWVLLAASAIMLYGGGTFFYGFSVFVYPMANDLGWNMTLISGAFSLCRLEAGVAAPFAGFLLDRFGPRKLVTGGAIIWGVGLIYLSQVTTVLSFYVAFILISAGFSFTSGSAMGAPVVGKWFVKKRGRAIGLFIASAGLGGLFVPVLSYLIELYGWRGTLLMMGPATWVIILALSCILRHTPEEHGLLPDGDTSGYTQGTPDAPKIVRPMEVDFSLGEAMRTRVFWILTLCFFLFQMTMSALFVHIVPYLITVGIEAQSAAFVVTFVTLTSILGRVGFGWFGDLLSRKRLLIVISLLQLVGFLSLTQVRQTAHIIPFLLFYAPSYGGMLALKPAIIGEYYGRKNYGTIYGTMQGMSLFGAIAGPVIAGFVYDTHGSYHLALVCFALLNILLFLLLLFLKSPAIRNAEPKLL